MKRMLNTIYVTSEDAWLRKDGANLVVEVEGTERGRAPLHLLDGVVSFGRAGASPALLAACAEAFLPRALDPGVRGSWNGKPLLDCCGTGGGGLNLINISTGLMFVLAAMGIPVVKHGNRGITKRSGSADVLEAMGIGLEPEEYPDTLPANGGDQ